MDLMSIGTLNSYIKNLKLQSQWTLKQQTGNCDAKGTSLEDWLDGSPFRTEDGGTGEHGDDTLRKIHQKLEAGGSLTQKERDYLQDHDPEAYRELVNQEKEQRAYEQALRRCKTQEEAERLQMSRISASLTRVRSVEHNPNIPLSEKLKIAMAEKQRVDRVAESTRAFVSSGEFAALPDRAEEMAANEDGGKVPASPPEAPDRPEKPDQPEAEKAVPEGKDSAPDPESPEERKVRRARAKAAYAAARTPARPDAERVDMQA